MDPSLLTYDNVAIVLLSIAVGALWRENTQLRGASMTLLKKYQERDEEELRLRREEDRRRPMGTSS